MEADASLAFLWMLFAAAWVGILVLFTAMEYPTASNAERVARQLARAAQRSGVEPHAVFERKRAQTRLSASVLRWMGFLAVPAAGYIMYRNLVTLSATLPAATAAAGLLEFLLVAGLFYLSFVATYWIPATLRLAEERLGAGT